jgi:OSK domain
MRKFERNVIINIGSWDLFHQSTAKEMIEIFKDLIAVLRVKEIRQPVITTLAPLGNRNLPEKIEEELRKFNRFLRDQPNCIDLHEMMVDRDNRTKSATFKQ